MALEETGSGNEALCECLTKFCRLTALRSFPSLPLSICVLTLLLSYHLSFSTAFPLFPDAMCVVFSVLSGLAFVASIVIHNHNKGDNGNENVANL